MKHTHIQLDEYETRVKEEVKRLKSLNLTNSKDTQWDYNYRMYVPRTRVIGSDGKVRATRSRNENPIKPPKDSEYARLYSAFAKMRKDGAYAKWNIIGQTYTDYWCNLPELKQPMITHYKSDDTLNFSYSTGMSWTKNWECVQDNVSIDTQKGGLEILANRLTEAGFNFKVITGFYTLEDDVNLVNLVFRGKPKWGDLDDNDWTIWDWMNNAMDGGPPEPPAIDF